MCTGNIKFDQPELDASDEHLSLTRGMLLSNEEELIVAGSTHPGEEKELLAGYARLREHFPSLVLMLAPRHVERAPEVEATIRAAGFEAVRRSRLPSSVPQGAARVVILDTRGELAMVYRHAVLAFVGGTFVPVGGHNMLEPAVWAKPVLFGVHTDHCVEVADLLLEARGACRVANGTELAAEITRLLRDRPALLAMGRAAREVVVKNRGGLERAVDLILTVLSRQRDGLATMKPKGRL
jgi:3-deoxy-D-manno-octulosonic-acid transferase